MRWYIMMIASLQHKIVFISINPYNPISNSLQVSHKAASTRSAHIINIQSTSSASPHRVKPIHPGTARTWPSTNSFSRIYRYIFLNLPRIFHLISYATRARAPPLRFPGAITWTYIVLWCVQTCTMRSHVPYTIFRSMTLASDRAALSTI